MRRLRVTVAYDGTDYCGWQFQTTGRSIQGTFEAAWQRITGETIRVSASGRTDAGVHALGQVVSLSTASALSVDTLQRALNASLPSDIRVRQLAEAADDFHAIRDAVSKRYRYLVQDGPIVDVFCRRYAWHVPQHLDITAMRCAAEWLVGEHDFAALQTSGSPRVSTIRHVYELTLQRRPGPMAELACLEIEANGFLYNMVRNIVGTLVQVGRGKQPPEWVERVLETRDRRQAGPTAPARGLYLVSVRY